MSIINVGINGFGRIGRNIARCIVESGRSDIRVVAINDLSPPETSAHLLRYDSVHGAFPGDIKIEGDVMDMGLGPIKMTALREPSELPWSDVDIALECTGFFVDKDSASQHLENGSNKVLISAPAKGVERTIVYGVNHADLTPDDKIVSNASCTTNCLSPVAKVLSDSVGIEKGYMTTIHAYTGDQPVLDRGHKDLYRARSAVLSMVPTTTGAASAVGLVLPELAGKLSGSAIRVPTPNVSCVDFKFVSSRDCDVDEINAVMKSASEGFLAGILGYNSAPLVSSDFNHTSESSIFAPAQTSVTSKNLVRVLSWYDNEWGFSNRMCDTAVHMGNLS